MKSILSICLLLVAGSSFAQSDFFMHREVRDAIQNGTRSLTGEPGPNYWQNRSVYDIEVEIVPATRQLIGKQTVTYYNNSPDTLKRLVVQLHQDIMKKSSPRDWDLGETEDLHDGTHVSLLLIDSTELDLDPDKRKVIRSGTNMFVTLPSPLAPNSSLNMTIHWDVVITKDRNVRMGTFFDRSFFIAYWYPKIAVYDDVFGWDTFGYQGSHETYHDFGDYTVDITVPNSYVVWATGEWLNPDETLTKPYTDRYKKALKSEKVVNIITKADREKQGITQNKPFLTYRFKANNVPDFTWAASMDFLWDGNVAKVGDRLVFADAAYHESSEDFYEVAEVSKKSIEYFSSRMPAYPFPWPKVTVFNGSGGMEFPMMINDGSSRTREGMVGVTSHEMAHQYMPFMMGTNEKMYAWMDEGWAVFLPFEFQETEGKYDPRARYKQWYRDIAGTTEDIPLMIPNVELRGAYRNVAYGRPAIAYDMLYKGVGHDRFIAGLKVYMDRWKYKHPIAYDFFFSMNEGMGEDFGWFWQPWFFDNAYADLAVKSVRQDGNKVRVQVENVGGAPTPIELTLMGDGEQSVSVSGSLMLWKSGEKVVTVEAETAFPVTKVVVGHQHIADANDMNDTWEVMK